MRNRNLRVTGQIQSSYKHGLIVSATPLLTRAPASSRTRGRKVPAIEKSERATSKLWWGAVHHRRRESAGQAPQVSNGAVHVRSLDQTVDHLVRGAFDPFVHTGEEKFRSLSLCRSCSF